MRVGVLHAFAYARLYLQQEVLTKRAFSEYAAQGNRKARALFPPGAEVEQFFQVVARIGEAAFMNNETRGRLSA